MAKSKLTYENLLDLGFQRNDIMSGDSIFFNRHGYRCFWLEKTLYKNRQEHVYLEWDPTTCGKLELLTCSKEKDITSRREITTKEMQTLVKVFNRKGNLPQPTNYTHAC